MTLFQRVGKAICEAEHNGLCVCAPNFTAHCRRPNGSIQRMARAAIANLREPSEAMVESVVSRMQECGFPADDGDAKRAWHVGIDAALAEGDQ